MELTLNGLDLRGLLADPRIKTPAYVYDLDAIAAEARDLRAGFGAAEHLVAYAVKANACGSVIRALAAEGCGADVVSGAELLLARRAGIAANGILFSGVAKTDEELDVAIAEGICAIQAESVEEIARIAARARAAGRVARISLRLNPGVAQDTLETHSYIATGHDEAKFGLPQETMPAALDVIAGRSELSLVGLTAHVGSQLTTLEAYLAGARALFATARAIRPRFALTYVDTGGGFGIDYGNGAPPRPAEFIRATVRLQAEIGIGDLALYCEPGRCLVGAHGVLLARVIQRKEAGTRRWIMIDAGMNDLIRPALYQARHRIVPLTAAQGVPTRVVGPVCESSDDFGVHDLPAGALSEVAILDAGAYGYAMASRYNGRALPTEVFLRGGAIVSVSSRRPLVEWSDERAAV